MYSKYSKKGKNMPSFFYKITFSGNPFRNCHLNQNRKHNFRWRRLDYCKLHLHIHIDLRHMRYLLRKNSPRPIDIKHWRRESCKYHHRDSLLCSYLLFDVLLQAQEIVSAQVKGCRFVTNKLFESLCRISHNLHWLAAQIGTYF